MSGLVLPHVGVLLQLVRRSWVRRRRDRQRDVGCHAPSVRSADPFQNHQERLRDRNLSGIGNCDADGDVGFGNVVGQRYDLFPVIVGIDSEWAGLIEVVEMLEDDLRAPEACPVAFCRRCSLGNEKRVWRNPDKLPYGCNVMPIFGIDQPPLERPEGFYVVCVQRPVR